MSTGHSDTTTEGIRVRVAGQYLPEHSDPDARSWSYVYRVIMSNEGEETVQLVNAENTRCQLIQQAEQATDLQVGVPYPLAQ